MTANPKRYKKNLEEIIYNGKIPPQALDLEEAILGAAMLEKNAPEKIIELIKPITFYSDANKLVWQAIVSLYRERNPIDILTVIQQLKKEGNLELSGGVFYVTQLTNRVASAANIEYHAHLIIQKWIQREIITIAGEIGKLAFEDETDAFELKDLAAAMIENIGTFNGGKIESFGDIAMKAYKQMLENSVSETDILGLPSSIHGINKISLGYCAPDVIVLAGGTGEGKTTLAFQEAYTLAKSGHPTAFLCAEMKALQLVWKSFSKEISEEIKEIRLAKNIDIEKWDQLTEFVKQAHTIPLYIVDVSNNNINQICSITKELLRKYKIKMMFLDYLQLIDGPPEQKFSNREAEVSHVSKKLKQLAMEINIPIMELSQLLDIDGGTKRLYAMRDLRESKAIGHNADEVIFIYHPNSHGVTGFDKDPKEYGKDDAILIRAKCRQGKKGKIDVKFSGEFNSFTDYDKEITNIDFTEPTKEKDLPF